MNDDQLRELMSSRDPAASLPPARPERVARLLEDTMSPDVQTPADQRQEADPRRRTPLTWVLAAAAVLVIAGVGFFALNGGEGRQPTATPPSSEAPRTVLHLTAPPPTQGRCAMVTARLLGNQDSAFDGTVTAIDGRSVTLEVSHWYRGGDQDLVVVEAPDPEMQALIQSVTFDQGGRYLVSATDGIVTVCGFSAAYSDDLAAIYAEAFGA
ncbi:hypothetical protein ISU10_18135 [Nocardioides agariphilus]|uniref:Uncharacterized protein n=1 Tax=Nocardioides agariphilus TaxID=433664 RepID=A0A930YJU5_9ACTN|nr:hypothetical protein [Nocardioides agariphilus]MBF4769692.1 hypothetical protein [Nocardioides agariphilus]